MQDRASVPSADFIRNIGHWQNEALRQPISITHHGRERLILGAPDAVLATPQDAVAFLGELTALRADLATLQENLDQGYLVVDERLRVQNSNVAAEIFAGVSREELRHATILSVFPAPFASILAERVQRIIRDRLVERLDSTLPDGRRLAVCVFPVEGGAGVLMRNETETFNLKRRLEESLALREAVRHCSWAAVLKIDAGAKIEGVDGTFSEWFGLASTDVVGRPIVDLVSKAQRGQASDMIDGVMRDAKMRQMQISLLGQAGEEIEGVLALAPILSDFSARGAKAIFTKLDLSQADLAA